MTSCQCRQLTHYSPSYCYSILDVALNVAHVIHLCRQLTYYTLGWSPEASAPAAPGSTPPAAEAEAEAADLRPPIIPRVYRRVSTNSRTQDSNMDTVLEQDQQPSVGAGYDIPESPTWTPFAQAGSHHAQHREQHNPLEAAVPVNKDIPIVFLHGVTGLFPYLELITYVVALGHPVIVFEYKHVAMRFW